MSPAIAHAIGKALGHYWTIMEEADWKSLDLSPSETVKQIKAMEEAYNRSELAYFGKLANLGHHASCFESKRGSMVFQEGFFKAWCNGIEASVQACRPYGDAVLTLKLVGNKMKLHVEAPANFAGIYAKSRGFLESYLALVTELEKHFQFTNKWLMEDVLESVKL